MLKILKKGKRLNSWYIGSCKRCECLFALDGNDPADVKRIAFNTSNDRIASCPNCGNRHVALRETKEDTVIYYSNFPERYGKEDE